MDTNLIHMEDLKSHSTEAQKKLTEKQMFVQLESGEFTAGI